MVARTFVLFSKYCKEVIFCASFSAEDDEEEALRRTANKVSNSKDVFSFP